MSRLTHLGRALGLGLGDLAAPLVEVIGGSVSHVNTGLVLGAGDGGHLAGALGAGAAKAAAAEVRARGKSTDGGHVGSGEGKCTRRSVNGECASNPRCRQKSAAADEKCSGASSVFRARTPRSATFRPWFQGFVTKKKTVRREHDAGSSRSCPRSSTRPRFTHPPPLASSSRPPLPPARRWSTPPRRPAPPRSPRTPRIPAPGPTRKRRRPTRASETRGPIAATARASAERGTRSARLSGLRYRLRYL